MGARHAAAVAAIFCMVFSVATGSASASTACPDDETIPSTASAATAALALVCDINAIRTRQGLRPLRWSWHLWASAQRMAGDIASRRYFSHVTPDGVNLQQRVAPTGYIPSTPTWMLAENLAWGTSHMASPLAIVFGWLNSPGHRRNVLDPKLSDIGIGMAEGSPSPGSGNGMIYVADFGDRGSVRQRGSRARPARRR